MNIEFNRTAYFYGQRNQETEHTSGFDSAVNQLQLSYGNATRKDVAVHYNSSGWFGRKIVALPNAACALVKMVYHLCLAIFIGIPKMLFGDSDALKARSLYMYHDLLEGLGWILTFFNDFDGQKVVQETEYNKTCYDLFLSKDHINLVQAKKRYNHLNIKEYENMRPWVEDRGQLLETLDKENFKEIFPSLEIYLDLKHIPEKHIPHIDYSKIGWREIYNLFPYSTYSDKAASTRKFHLLTSAQVECILDDLLSDQMPFISEEQKKGSDRIQKAYDKWVERKFGPKPKPSANTYKSGPRAESYNPFFNFFGTDDPFTGGRKEKPKESDPFFGTGGFGFNPFGFDWFFGGAAGPSKPENDEAAPPSPVMPTVNHYTALGLQPGATQDEIRKAYKKLAMKHHPDRGGDEEKFKKIQNAYETLYTS